MEARGILIDANVFVIKLTNPRTTNHTISVIVHDN
jgi:hypothetical protein